MACNDVGLNINLPETCIGRLKLGIERARGSEKGSWSVCEDADDFAVVCVYDNFNELIDCSVSFVCGLCGLWCAET